MKRKLSSLVVASLLGVSVAEAKVYIGIDAGFTGALNYGNIEGMYYGRVVPEAIKYVFKTYRETVGNESVTQKPFGGLNVSLTFGTEDFYLNDYLGFRWGASVGYTKVSQITEFYSKHESGTSIESTEESYSFLDAGLSLDMIVNLWNNGNYSIGVFGGIEGEYHYLLDGRYRFSFFQNSGSLNFKKLHSFGVNGRAGLTTLLAKHHRLDFTTKLPVMIAGDNGPNNQVAALARVSFNAGYRYVF